MTNPGGNYAFKNIVRPKSEQNGHSCLSNHRQLTNSLIDPNIDLPLITEEKVGEVFDNFKRYNSLSLPRKESTTHDIFITNTQNGLKIPAKVIKLPATTRSKVIRVSLTKEGERERENNLNVRKANREKIFRNGNLGEIHPSREDREPVKSRCLLKCPHQSCGLRYQLHALIRHLLIYHEDSIEEIPNMLNLSSDDLRCYLNSNNTSAANSTSSSSESTARLHNINMRRSFNSIHPVTANTNNSSTQNIQAITNCSKVLKNEVTVHQTIPIRKSLNGIRLTQSEQDDNEAGSFNRFIDDSAITSKSKFHVITLPRRSLNKLPDQKVSVRPNVTYQARGKSLSLQSSDSITGYPLRPLKTSAHNKEPSPISSSLSSLTLSAKSNIDCPTIFEAPGKKVKVVHRLRSIRISSPDDYVPVGKTTFHSSTNLKTAPQMTGDFVYPPVGLLITSNQEQIEANNEKTLVGSSCANIDETQRDLQTFLRSIQMSEEGETPNLRSNEEVLMRRRSLSATITEQEIFGNQQHSDWDNSNQNSRPEESSTPQNQLYENNSKNPLVVDTNNQSPFDYSFTSKASSIHGQSTTPNFYHRTSKATPEPSNRIIRPSSVLAQYSSNFLPPDSQQPQNGPMNPVQFRSKATPNVRLVYECPIRDCTAVFPSEPAFQRHFDSVHDKVSSGGLIIAQPFFNNQNHHNMAAYSNGYYQSPASGMNQTPTQNNPPLSLRSPDMNENSFIDSLDLFMPSRQQDLPNRHVHAEQNLYQNNNHFGNGPSLQNSQTYNDSFAKAPQQLLMEMPQSEVQNQMNPSSVQPPSSSTDTFDEAICYSQPSATSLPESMEINQVLSPCHGDPFQCTPTNEMVQLNTQQGTIPLPNSATTQSNVPNNYQGSNQIQAASMNDIWSLEMRNMKMTNVNPVPYKGSFGRNRERVSSASLSSHQPISYESASRNHLITSKQHQFQDSNMYSYKKRNSSQSPPASLYSEHGSNPTSHYLSQQEPNNNNIALHVKPRTKYNSGQLNYEPVGCDWMNEYPSHTLIHRQTTGSMPPMSQEDHFNPCHENSDPSASLYPSQISYLGPGNESDRLSHTSSIDDAFIDIDTTTPLVLDDGNGFNDPACDTSFNLDKESNNIEDSDMEILNKIIDDYSLFQFQVPSRTRRDFRRRVPSPILSIVDLFDDEMMGSGASNSTHGVCPPSSRDPFQNSANNMLSNDQNQDNMVRPSGAMLKHYECPDTWQFQMNPSADDDFLDTLSTYSSIALSKNPSPTVQTSPSPHLPYQTSNNPTTNPFIGGGLLSSLSAIAVSSNECVRTSNRANQLLSDIIRRRREVLRERQLGQQKPTTLHRKDLRRSQTTRDPRYQQRRHLNSRDKDVLLRESSLLSMVSSSGGFDTSSNMYHSSTCSSTHSRHKRRHSQLSRNTSFIAEDSPYFSEQYFVNRPTSLDLATTDDLVSSNNSISTPSSPNHRSDCKRRSLNSITDYWSKSSIVGRTHLIGPSCSVDLIRS